MHAGRQGRPVTDHHLHFGHLLRPVGRNRLLHYYNQAMLPLIGQSFSISAVHVGQIAMLTQIGYAFGLLLFVPLGDRLQRKTLILVILAFNALSLVASALAPSFVLLLVASAALGLSAISA